MKSTSQTEADREVLLLSEISREEENFFGGRVGGESRG